MQIYLLMGQSNMAGRGPLTEQYQKDRPRRVLMLDQDNRLVPAKHPVHFDKPKIAAVGPGLSFGQAMAEAHPRDTIVLVPCAVGGTAISKWTPGAYDAATGTHPYDDALERIKVVQPLGVIKGVIWLQGEADSKPELAKDYLQHLKTLIGRIRAAVNDPHLPFIAGELGRYRPRYSLINEVLQQLPLQVRYSDIVSSEGLTHKGDSTHFDSPSAVEYGRRFAEALLRLQKVKVN